MSALRWVSRIERASPQVFDRTIPRQKRQRGRIRTSDRSDRAELTVGFARFRIGSLETSRRGLTGERTRRLARRGRAKPEKSWVRKPIGGGPQRAGRLVS